MQYKGHGSFYIYQKKFRELEYSSQTGWSQKEDWVTDCMSQVPSQSKHRYQFESVTVLGDGNALTNLFWPRYKRESSPEHSGANCIQAPKAIKRKKYGGSLGVMKLSLLLILPIAQKMEFHDRAVLTTKPNTMPTKDQTSGRRLQQFSPQLLRHSFHFPSPRQLFRGKS